LFRAGCGSKVREKERVFGKMLVDGTTPSPNKREGGWGG